MQHDTKQRISAALQGFVQKTFVFQIARRRDNKRRKWRMKKKK